MSHKDTTTFEQMIAFLPDELKLAFKALCQHGHENNTLWENGQDKAVLYLFQDRKIPAARIADVINQKVSEAGLEPKLCVTRNTIIGLGVRRNRRYSSSLEISQFGKQHQATERKGRPYDPTIDPRPLWLSLRLPAPTLGSGNGVP